LENNNNNNNNNIEKEGMKRNFFNVALFRGAFVFISM
jgi:hypothetical protein